MATPTVDEDLRTLAKEMLDRQNEWTRSRSLLYEVHDKLKHEGDRLSQIIDEYTSRQILRLQEIDSHTSGWTQRSKRFDTLVNVFRLAKDREAADWASMKRIEESHYRCSLLRFPKGFTGPDYLSRGGEPWKGFKPEKKATEDGSAGPHQSPHTPKDQGRSRSRGRSDPETPRDGASSPPGTASQTPGASHGRRRARSGPSAGPPKDGKEEPKQASKSSFKPPRPKSFMAKAREHAAMMPTPATLSEWLTKCEAIFTDYSAATSFPDPPAWPCVKPACRANEGQRALRACDCNLTFLYGMIHESTRSDTLKAHRISFHPDKFSVSSPELRDEFKGKAQELFVVVNRLLEERKGR